MSSPAPLGDTAAALLHSALPPRPVSRLSVSLDPTSPTLCCLWGAYLNSGSAGRAPARRGGEGAGLPARRGAALRPRRLTSRCSRSMRSFRNSWASCWLEPESGSWPHLARRYHPPRQRPLLPVCSMSGLTNLLPGPLRDPPPPPQARPEKSPTPSSSPTCIQRRRGRISGRQLGTEWDSQLRRSQGATGHRSRPRRLSGWEWGRETKVNHRRGTGEGARRVGTPRKVSNGEKTDDHQIRRLGKGGPGGGGCRPTFSQLLGSAPSRHLLPEVPSQTEVPKRPSAAQTL